MIWVGNIAVVQQSLTNIEASNVRGQSKKRKSYAKHKLHMHHRNRNSFYGGRENSTVRREKAVLWGERKQLRGGEEKEQCWREGEQCYAETENSAIG